MYRLEKHSFHSNCVPQPSWHTSPGLKHLRDFLLSWIFLQQIQFQFIPTATEAAHVHDTIKDIGNDDNYTCVTETDWKTTRRIGAAETTLERVMLTENEGDGNHLR